MKWYPSLQSCSQQKSSKNRPKNLKKSRQVTQKRQKTPKSAQDRHKALGPQSSSTLGVVLGRSWCALGTPRTRPGPSKTQPRTPKLEPKTIFYVFFHIFFSRRFSYRIFSPKLCNDWYRNLENINFPQGKRIISQNRLCRLATTLYRKNASQTFRFEGQNRKNS